MKRMRQPFQVVGLEDVTAGAHLDVTAVSPQENDDARHKAGDESKRVHAAGDGLAEVELSGAR